MNRKDFFFAVIVLVLAIVLTSCASEGFLLGPNEQQSWPDVDAQQPPAVEWTAEELAAIEKFKSQPKEDWGIYDFSLYDVYGNVVATGLFGFEGGVPPTLGAHTNAITYRGFKMGDDAHEVLSSFELPYGTVIVVRTTQNPGGSSQPYSLELAKSTIEQTKERVNICIYFDKNFNVIDATDIWPELISEANITIVFLDGQLIEYSAIVGHYDYGSQNTGER